MTFGERLFSRILEEALTNAFKHGHAKRAAIEIVESRTAVELTVRDDGDGFDPTASTTGCGLLGVRARVQLLHGAVEIESSAGNGTIVTATFPAQRRPAEAASAARPPIRLTGS
jgi:signal transduction histidine kinase